MQKSNLFKRLIYFLGLISFGLVMVFALGTKASAETPITVSYKSTLTGDFDIQIPSGTSAIDYDLGVYQGQRHLGWFDGTGHDAQEHNFEPLSENVTLYAKWEYVTYKINLHILGVTDPVVVTGTIQDLLGKIQDAKPASETGHKFSEWYLENTYVTRIKTQLELQHALLSADANDELNLYGKQVKQSYLSIFDFNGTLVYVWTPYGEAIQLPDDVGRTGYTLVAGSGKFTPEVPATMPDETLRFTANYVQTKVDITFNNDNDSELKVIGVDYGAIPVYGADPVSSLAADDADKYYHVFVGWDETLEPATEAKTYTAVYIKYPYLYQLKQIIGETSYLVDIPYNTLLSEVDPVDLPYGYNFSSWQGVLEDTKMPASSHTVTAVLTPIQYTVSFNSAGGSAVQSITQNYNTTINSFTEPTKEGHTFAGWYLASEKIEAPYLVVGNVELTAHWDVNSYDLTYKVDGQVAAPVERYEYNEAIVMRVAPTKAGYTFSGWSQTLTHMPAEDTTITGTFTANTDTAYQVVHKRQTLTGTYDDEDLWETDNLTGTTDTNTNGEPKTTYTHFTAKSFSQVNINGDGSTVLVIEYQRKSYTVTFNLDGGTPPIGSQSVLYEGTVNKPADPTKTGYTFSNWRIESTPNNWTVYNFETPVEKGFELKAFWTAKGDTAYTVVHHTQKDTLDGYVEHSQVPMTGTTGHDTEASSIAITGFEAQAFSQLPIAGDGSTVVNIYYDRSEYTVSFNTQGGSAAPASVNQKYGLTIAKPADPTKEGYVFNGWATSAQGTEAVVWPYTVSKSETLYAIWEPATDTSYTVRHAFENKSNPDQFDIVMTYDEDKTGTTGAPAVAEPKVFVHFNHKDTEEKTIAADGSTKVIVRYTRKSYTVSFNSDGGSAVSSQSVKFEYKASEPAAPTKTGYTFNEWQKFDSGTNDWVTYQFTAEVIGDIQLKATWNPVQVPVTFNVNGGTLAGLVVTQNFPYDGKITNPGNPTPPVGYTFKHWALSGSEEGYDFNNTTINTTNQITLVALYSKITPTLTIGGTHAANVAAFINDSTTPYNPLTDTIEYGDTVKLVFTYDDTNYDASLTVNDHSTSFTNKKHEFDIYEDTTVAFALTHKKVTVTFNTQGGSAAPAAQTINKGGKASEPAKPTKDYHKFSHWATTIGGVTSFDFNSAVNESMTLYAVYNKDKYTVTYNVDHVTVTLDDLDNTPVASGSQVERDLVIVITPKTIPGQELVKIEVEVNAIKTVLAHPYNHTVQADVAIIATFQVVPIPTQQITFNVTLAESIDASFVPSTIYLVYNDNISEAKALVKDGDVYTIVEELEAGNYSYNYYYVNQSGKYETLADEFTKEARTLNVGSVAATVEDEIVAWNYLVTGKAKVTINTQDRTYQYLPEDRRDTIYIVGNIPGKNWVQGDQTLLMTHGQDNNYSITLVLPKGYALEYKYVRGSTNRDWELYEGKLNRPNRTITLSNDNEQTINDTKLKADPDESRRQIDDWHEYAFLQPENRALVTFNVTLSQPLPSFLEDQLRVVGDIPLYSEWDRNDPNLRMTKQGNVYSVTIEVPIDMVNSISYKYSLGRQDIYYENRASDRTFTPNSATITITDNDIVWGDYVNGLSSLEGKEVRLVKFSVNDVSSSNMYVTGTFENVNWNATLLKMSKNTSTNRFEFDMWLENNSDPYSYKYTKDSGTYEGGSDRTLLGDATTTEDTWQN